MNHPNESGGDAPGDGYEGYLGGWAEFLKHEVGGEFREDVGYEEDGDGDLELGRFEGEVYLWHYNHYMSSEQRATSTARPGVFMRLFVIILETGAES